MARTKQTARVPESESSRQMKNLLKQRSINQVYQAKVVEVRNYLNHKNNNNNATISTITKDDSISNNNNNNTSTTIKDNSDSDSSDNIYIDKLKYTYNNGTISIQRIFGIANPLLLKCITDKCFYKPTTTCYYVQEKNKVYKHIYCQDCVIDKYKFSPK